MPTNKTCMPTFTRKRSTSHTEPAAPTGAVPMSSTASHMDALSPTSSTSTWEGGGWIYELNQITSKLWGARSRLYQRRFLQRMFVGIRIYFEKEIEKKGTLMKKYARDWKMKVWLKERSIQSTYSEHSQCSLESFRRDLQDLHTSAPLRLQIFSKCFHLFCRICTISFCKFILQRCLLSELSRFVK